MSPPFHVNDTLCCHCFLLRHICFLSPHLPAALCSAPFAHFCSLHIEGLIVSPNRCYCRWSSDNILFREHETWRQSAYYSVLCATDTTYGGQSNHIHTLPSISNPQRTIALCRACQLQCLQYHLPHRTRLLLIPVVDGSWEFHSER